MIYAYGQNLVEGKNPDKFKIKPPNQMYEGSYLKYNQLLEQLVLVSCR